MTSSKDTPQPPQPDNNLNTGGENRPRRFRRERPTYPTSPIEIPLERKEEAYGSLTAIYELWEKGRHYDALIEWFGLPSDRREDVINSVLLQEAKSDRSLRDIQYDTKGKPEHLIFKHYALFSTEAVKKLVRPNETDPINANDLNDLSSNPGYNHEFQRKVLSLGLGYDPYFHDMGDFIEPNSDIQVSFTIEEAREFFLKFVPHINDEVRNSLLSAWGIVSGIKHADLLTDRRLADYLERPLLGEIDWSSRIENFISQNVFPSPEFFEEAFRRLDPKDSDPNAKFFISVNNVRDTEIPGSTFYFLILRKIVNLKNIREEVPEYGIGTEEKITAYLLNDAFMEHVIPYLETQEIYKDNLVYSAGNAIIHNTEIEATGEEAKRIKKERLAEVIQTAIDFATRKGDMETVKKLKEREVYGFKFSSLL